MQETDQTRALAPVDKLKEILTVEKAGMLKAALGGTVSQEKFIQCAVVAYSKNPDLGGAPGELMNAVFECASYGLLPNGKEAALIGFGQGQNKKITCMVMVEGSRKMIFRTGVVKDLTVEIARENDDWTEPYTDETGTHFRHTRARKDRGAYEKVYCLLRTKDGGIFFFMMEKDEVLQRKKESKNPKMWDKWPKEMWEKTILHKVRKFVKDLGNGTGETDGMEFVKDEEPDFQEMPDNIGERADAMDNITNKEPDEKAFDFSGEFQDNSDIF